MLWHLNRWCLESKHLQAIWTTVTPVNEQKTKNNLSQTICTSNWLAEADRLKIVNIFLLTRQLWSPGCGSLVCCADKKCETISILTRKEYHDWVDGDYGPECEALGNLQNSCYFWARQKLQIKKLHYIRKVRVMTSDSVCVCGRSTILKFRQTYYFLFFIDSVWSLEIIMHLNLYESCICTWTQICV